jgi:hypothetical protein
MSRSFVFKSFLAERTETRELHQKQLLEKLDSFQIDSMVDAIFSLLWLKKQLTLLLLEIKQISCVILQNKTKQCYQIQFWGYASKNSQYAWPVKSISLPNNHFAYLADLRNTFRCSPIWALSFYYRITRLPFHLTQQQQHFSLSLVFLLYPMRWRQGKVKKSCRARHPSKKMIASFLVALCQKCEIEALRRKI